MLAKIRKEKRSPEQVRTHYEMEKKLADRLRNADREERRHLYPVLYDELMRNLPHHPQHAEKENEERYKESLEREIRILKRFLRRDIAFLEISKGDYYGRAFEITKYVSKVFVMKAIRNPETQQSKSSQPENFEFIESDGVGVDIAPESIDIVLSDNLIEHLHPDDAREQTEGVFNCLVPGGKYLCLTPHRYRGPSDISRDFDTVATGFHLKEYTNFELYRLLKQVGFSKVKSLLRVKGIFIILPVYPVLMIEYVLNPLPYIIRKKISKSLLVRHLLSIFLVATK